MDVPRKQINLNDISKRILLPSFTLETFGTSNKFRPLGYLSYSANLKKQYTDLLD